MELGTQNNSLNNTVPSFTYINSTIGVPDKVFTINGNAAKLANLFGGSSLEDEENSGLQNGLDKFTAKTYPLLFAQVNAQIAQQMTMIKLDESDLYFNFNLN